MLALSVITCVILQFMVLRNALGFGYRECPFFFVGFEDITFFKGLIMIVFPIVLPLWCFILVSFENWFLVWYLVPLVKGWLAWYFTVQGLFFVSISCPWLKCEIALTVCVCFIVLDWWVLALRTATPGIQIRQQTKCIFV